MNLHPRLIVATLLTSVALAASAQSTQSIEVLGSTLRTDVRTLCPEIDHDLHESLANTVREVAASAVMDVRFELKGSRVGAVQVGHGPAAYQRMLKRAVRSLQCDAKDNAPQQVAFRVRFVDPFDRSARVAGAGAIVVAASAPQR